MSTISTEFFNHTLEIIESSTYCPIGKEWEEIIIFRLTHDYEGESVVDMNESLNLEVLEISRDRVQRQMNYYDSKIYNDYNCLMASYYAFMVAYAEGMLMQCSSHLK